MQVRLPTVQLTEEAEQSDGSGFSSLQVFVWPPLVHCHLKAVSVSERSENVPTVQEPLSSPDQSQAPPAHVTSPHAGFAAHWPLCRW